MTSPFMQQQPSAQRPWVQQPGGYDAAQQFQQPQQQQQPGMQALPSQMQQQQQPFQQQMLPPQMQQQPGMLQQIDGQSPLSQMQPVAPQMQQRQFVPQQQPFQQQQPMQQQQPAQPQQQPVLSGPGVPVELQGRTLAEAIAIYNGMRQTHLQGMQMQAQPQQQVQQRQFQPQQQVQQQQQPGQQQQFDWRNPGQAVAQVVDERINAAIEQKLMPMLAPIAAQNAMTGIERARQTAAQSVGQQNFLAVEAEVMQLLQGADPATLGNANAWTLAAQTAVGRRAIAGQQQQQQFQQQPQQQRQGPGMYPVQQVQQGQNPMPNLGSFFSEQPNQGGPGSQGMQLTQAQVAAADAMGFNHADYAAWAVGIGRGTSR